MKTWIRFITLFSLITLSAASAYGEPTISVDDVTVTEHFNGVKHVTFTVILSEAGSDFIHVFYTTSDSTATDGSDYNAITGTLTFGSGETSRPVIITIRGDEILEGDEYFKVILSDPIGASISDNTGICTIKDAESFISISDVTVTEGDAVSAEFLVRLSPGNPQTVTVDKTTISGTATSGEDFREESGTVAFAPYQSSRWINITILSDSQVEDPEFFKVVLSNPSRASISDSIGVGTIVDEPLLSIDNVTLSEGHSGTTDAVFTVTLSPSRFQTVTVDYATSDSTALAGDDYNSAFGTLTFNAYETSQTITVIVNGDLNLENDEFFKVNLTNADNAYIAKNQGTGIIENDDFGIFIQDMTISEGEETAFIPVIKWPQYPLTADVDYSMVDGTATAWEDYDPMYGTITLLGSRTVNFISVPLHDDTFFEEDEYFFIELSNVMNTDITLVDNQGQCTILENDTPPTISINDTLIIEGNDDGTEADFTVCLSHASTDTVTVDYQIQPGTTADLDYGADSDDFLQPADHSLTFVPGDTSQILSILIISDIIWEYDEFFFVILENPHNATIEDGEGICTILNDDPLPEIPPAVTISDVTIVEGDNGFSNAVFTYNSDPAYSLWEGQFIYSTADGTVKAEEDYVAVSDGILFNPQVEISGTITVPIIGDGVMEGDEIFYLNLYQPESCTFADSQGVCTILNEDGAEINVAIADGMESIPIANNSTYNFHEVNIDSSRNCDLYIENAGDSWLLINLPHIIDDTEDDQFSISNRQDLEIAPGDTSIIKVIYSPTNASTHTATLMIENNDFDENPYKIDLTGTGINGGGNDDIEIKGKWFGQMPYALQDKDITYIFTSDTWTIDWVNESLGDVSGEILQYSNENNVAIARIAVHPDVSEQVDLYLKITWTMISSDSIVISHSDLFETMQEAVNGPTVGVTPYCVGTHSYSRIKEMRSITGSWRGLLPYAWADDRPLVFTIDDETAFVDWVDEEAGDVSFNVIQYDCDHNQAIMQITHNPDAPYQVGMYMKITWTVISANKISITWFMHNGTLNGTLNGTDVIGTYTYTGESTDVEKKPVVVTDFQLYQNYPNPFNPETVIKYALPKSGEVTLTIYDVHGREVCTLVRKVQKTGIYIIHFNADRFASGIYYYRLRLGTDYVQTRKMLLIH